MRKRVVTLAVFTVVAVVVWLASTHSSDHFVPTGRPFAGAGLYDNDPSLPVAEYARKHPDEDWAKSLAQVPRSHWLADDKSVNTLPAWLKGVDARRALPVVVIYRIPNRDCGHFSADNHALAAGAYDTWIGRIIRAMGKRKAVVIYEPDALAASCFDEQRADIMRLAVAKLARAGYTIYIDAGNARFRSVQEAKRRLEMVGIEKVQGFSLNVSSFYPTDETMRFGDALSHELENRHYIIDTSRNGQGPPADRKSPNWYCNPRDVGLGMRPTTNTGNELVDALLWVKNPDLSDGNCRPDDPKAGVFFPKQAQRLSQNAEPPV